MNFRTLTKGLMIVALLFSATVYAETNCNDLLKYEYPLGVRAKDAADKHYTYGLEVEYSIDDVSATLFEDYAPATQLLARETWLAMTVEQKREYLKANLEALFPEGPKGKSHFVRIGNDEWMAPDLIIDETGNVEFITPKIFHDKAAFYQYIDRLKARYGDGYVQASIGVPAEVFFKTSESKNNFLGLAYFLGEYDTLNKLADAYVKHLEIPQFVPGKSFTHPFLGPMNSPKARFLKNVMNHTSLGNFDKDVLDRISKTDVSYKYVSQAVYRPDILRNKEVFLVEVRQCVKDFDCLKKLLERQKFFFKHSASVFNSFAFVTHFDPIADYNMFSVDTQTMLHSAFPRLLERDTGDEILITEIFRNFAYPLTDWNKWLYSMGVKDAAVSSKVQAAQNAYQTELENIAQMFKATQIDAKIAGNKSRIALARFVFDSKLTETFEEFLMKHFEGVEAHLK